MTKQSNPPWNPEGKPSPAHYWEDDKGFQRIYRKVRDISVCDIHRLYMIWQIVGAVSTMQGQIAEVGVYKGGSAQLILETTKRKIVYLFDTFEGFPEQKYDGNIDWNTPGKTKADYKEVKRRLSRYTNCVLAKGIFPDEVEPPDTIRFAFVHIDVDLYQSTLDCYEYFYPRMVRGGFMVCDDYGFWGTTGTKQAIDEFFEDKPEYPMYLQSGQSLVMKM